jgi:GT2 family glycosyltransferase
MSYDLGIVIIDCNQPAITIRCLNSLVEGSRAPAATVVVENGDCKVECSESKYSRLNIHKISVGRNLGCAGGRNIGLNYLVKYTHVNRLVILDNDTIVPRDFVSKVMFTALPPLTIGAPVIYDFETGEIWSSGGTIDKRGKTIQLTNSEFSRVRVVDWVPGACFFMDKATWSSVGEFDAWMNFLYEDITWCHRLRQMGGIIYVLQDLTLVHEANQSLGGMWSPQRVYLWARNGTVFRTRIARVGFVATMCWLLNELGYASRDVLLGKLPWAWSRLGGLSRGLLRSAKLRWS